MPLIGRHFGDCNNLVVFYHFVTKDELSRLTCDYQAIVKNSVKIDSLESSSSPGDFTATILLVLLTIILKWGPL